MFRLIVEELDKGSLLCVLSKVRIRLQTSDKRLTTRMQSDTSADVSANCYYLLDCVKKPNLGSFKKKVTASSAMIHLLPASWSPE